MIPNNGRKLCTSLPLQDFGSDKEMGKGFNWLFRRPTRRQRPKLHLARSKRSRQGAYKVVQSAC